MTTTETDRFLVRSTKLPVDLAEGLDALAEQRNLSASALLRSIVEREIAAAKRESAGEVEAATLAAIRRAGIPADDARAAAAVNLARRIDRDPTSAAPNAAQWRMLIDDLLGSGREVTFDSVAMARLLRLLKMQGFAVVTADGRRFSLVADFDRDEYGAVLS